jgi:hypothetical protein
MRVLDAVSNYYIALFMSLKDAAKDSIQPLLSCSAHEVAPWPDTLLTYNIVLPYFSMLSAGFSA